MIRRSRERVPERLRTQLFYYASFECSCPKCREDIGLEVHHIDFDPSNNSLDNLIVLCPSHHKKAHANRISQKELRMHKERLPIFQAAKWQEHVDSWKSQFPTFDLLPDWDTVLAVRKVIWRELRLRVKDHASSREIATALRDITNNYFSILDKNIAEGFLKEEKLPRFVFAEMVAFPDSQGEYPKSIRCPAIPNGKVPIIIRGGRVVVEGKEYFLEGGKRFHADFLPLHNGFVWGEDKEYGLPCAVRNYSSRAFYGSYYWVVPFGLRAATKLVWFWNPIEARFGTAIYFSPDEGRPYIGALVGKRLSSS